jgi:hypothetical protein
MQSAELEVQAHQLQHHLQKMMRRFGRQCRGMGTVFVTLVRQTETQLLERGRQVPNLAKIPGVCAILGEGGVWHNLRAIV